MSKRRNIFIYLSLALAALLVANLLLGGSDPREEIPLNEFETRIVEGEVATATIKDRDNKVVGELEDGTEYEVSFPAEFGDELTGTLIENNVELDSDQQSQALWVALLFNFLPILLIVGVFLFFLSSMQGGGRGIMKFGKAKAREVTKDQPQVSFADVAGADEAVEELEEIKDFLEAPTRFQAMGAKIPKGVLLYGPPGTGKTLLARAVAGEAGVPFFTISGSDFVEMFVGVGASRVRDLFQQAKASAPAIIFIDEIDAVGRHRGAGLGGGHDEREQTLNQLLVEMDGFDVRTGVILIAATNRPDILDPALLRPGRFDRQIVVDMPDLVGRRQILEVHARNKPLADGINLEVIARRTPGFSGADIENLLNEGALLAARRGKALVGPSEIDEAIDRVMVGPERKNKVMSERERRITAFHEGGHALVGHVLPNTDPIHKVTIIPRGRAGGFTLALPLEEKSYRTRSELRDNLAMLLGGRTAEEMIFGDPTTGAANDIEKATEVARSMVTAYGMSDRLGPQRFVKADGDVFLGKTVGQTQEYSEEVAGIIDEEVARLIAEAHAEAEEILQLHRPVLDRLADALLEHETLNENDLQEIFSGIPAWEGSTVRPDVHPPMAVATAIPSLTGATPAGQSTGSSGSDLAPLPRPTGDANGQSSDSEPSGPPPEDGNGEPVSGPAPTGNALPLPHPSVPAGKEDPWKTPDGKPKRRWFNK